MTNRVFNISDYVADSCVGKDGEIYFVLTTGEVYKAVGVGLIDFVDDYNSSITLLSDMDASDRERSIVCDNNGNIYSVSGYDVKVFTYPGMAMSTFDTMDYIPYHLGLHEDGLLVTTEMDFTYVADAGNGQIGVYITDGTTITTIANYHPAPHAQVDVSNSGGVFSTENGDIYASLYFATNAVKEYEGIYRFNYSDSYSESTINTFASETLLPEDIYIDSTGIIYAIEESTNTISTYSTVGASGGYSFGYSEGSTGTTQLEYDESSIFSEYDTYYNNSDITIGYSINVDMDDSFGTLGNDQELIDGYKFKVVWINPDGIVQASNDIYPITFYFNSVEFLHSYIGGDVNAIKTGSITKSSPNWQNGTWTVQLKEFDYSTGLSAVLDTDTFEVEFNRTTTVIEDSATDATSLNDNLTNFLNSPIFIGIIILFGFLAVGSQNGIIGICISGIIGVSMLTLIGMIPTWIIFLLAMGIFGFVVNGYFKD